MLTVSQLQHGWLVIWGKIHAYKNVRNLPQFKILCNETMDYLDSIHDDRRIMQREDGSDLIHFVKKGEELKIRTSNEVGMIYYRATGTFSEDLILTQDIFEEWFGDNTMSTN